MASLGAITEVVNSKERTLEVGVDTYVGLNNLEWIVSRPEDKTLVVTTPELDSLNTLTQIDANGALTSTAWKIVYKDKAGSTKTAAATGVLRDFRVYNGDEGVILIDIFVRITGDTVTIS
jgi:hypothetical protein